MTAKFQKKFALVTGGNKGIGFAICKGLLAKGFEVVVAARSLEKAQTAVSKLENDGAIRAVELDITNDDSINSARRHLSQEIPQLNVLVNNAGIYPDEGVNILTILRDLLTQTMNTNAFGAVRVTQAFLSLLQKVQVSRVINVSSGFGEINGLSAEEPGYCLSKLALNGATIMLADALRGRKIAVYAMCPGWVKTDMGGASAPRTPEQGADTAIWLATEALLQQSGKYFRDAPKGAAKGDRKEISYQKIGYKTPSF